MPIQPAIQPPTPPEADSRPDTPPFAGTLEDASRSLETARVDGDRRETGASESADPARPSNIEAADRNTEDERSTSSSGESTDRTLGDEDSDPSPVELESGSIPNPGDQSDPVDVVASGPATLAGRIDSTSVLTAGGGGAGAPGEGGSPHPGGTDGQDRGMEAGRITTPGMGVAANVGSNTGLPDPSTASGQGMAAATNPAGPINQTTATAAASASGAVRSTTDQRAVTRTDSTGAAAATAPIGDGTGSKAIPEGMRVLDPAATAAIDPRSRGGANGKPETRPPAGTAVARAAEMNTELRNARADGDASNGARSTNAPGSTAVAAFGSISATAGVAGPSPTGPDAQSLPTGPASVAPVEANAESGRTLGGVARGLQALTSQRGGTLVMRLDPGNLGQVRMEMSLDAGRVQVVLAAAGDAARGLLRENLGVLRHALEDRGFAVERLTVESTARTTADSSGPRGDSRGDGQDARNGQGSSDRQDASDERSRGRRDDATHRRSERNRSESDRFQEVLAGSGGTSNE